MVHWRLLHFLQPQGPLFRLTFYGNRSASGSRRCGVSYILLGKGYLPSLVPLLLSGNLVGPFKKGGWPKGPQGDSRAIKDSVLSVGVSLWFATFEP